MFGETEVTLSDTVKIAFGDVSKRDGERAGKSVLDRIARRRRLSL
jgi:hypothetical protein